MPSRTTCLAAIALSLAVSACEQPPEPAPLEGASIGGDFTLTGETGAPVSWDDFDGQYRIIYFGYAYCPDVCPTDVQRSMAGLRAFEESEPELGGEIQPLFVSVDPERDTPEVLAEFTDNFHPRLIGLTGTTEELEAAKKTFAVYSARGEDQAGGGYLVDHSNITYLFGPDGNPIATLPTDKGPQAVAEELAKWVR